MKFPKPVALVLLLLATTGFAEEARPKLPEMSGRVEIEVRDGADKPARKLAVHLVYSKNRLSTVTAKTGLMLSLHNWGGTIWDNTPNPNLLAENYDLLVIGVTYYQSGDKETDPEPYDYSYLQTMDVLRALHYVYRSLQEAGHPFDATRIYCTGGSGGGHVTQMASKFAPNTFACIVDLSGMASLNDDMAFHLPGGSPSNARYSQDPASPAWLSPDMQEIRDLGHPGHLALQAKAGHPKIVVIHGEDDPVCLAPDKHRVVDAMRAAGLEVDAHFITKADIDGKVVMNSGHQIGDRTRLLMQFAGKYLSPESGEMCRLTKPNDFDRRGTVSYPTSHGVHAVSYAGEIPTLRFTATK
jgi:predicted esterase